MKKTFTTLTTIGLLSIAGIATPLILASCSSTPNQNNTTKPENKPEDKPTPTPPVTPEEPSKPTYPKYVNKGVEFLIPPYIKPYWVFEPAKDGKTNYFYKIGKDRKDEFGTVLYTEWYGVASYLPFDKFYQEYNKGIKTIPDVSSYLLYHSIMKLSFDFEKDWEKNTINYLSQMEESTLANTPTFGTYSKYVNTGKQDEIKSKSN